MPDREGREYLAEMLLDHLPPASGSAGIADDAVTVAAASRLRQWAELSSPENGTREDWRNDAPVVLCEEFLAPQEYAALCDFVLSREQDFEAATLVGHGVSGVFVDHSFRVAETLFDLGPFQEIFENRLEYYLPFACARLGLPEFGPHWFEFQLTAIRNRGFFQTHDDNSHEVNRTRRLTFVFYFFCSSSLPKGGKLRFWPERAWRGPAAFPPTANRMLFFDSSIPHEVEPFECSSDQFDAARFTINGWVHQGER